jgi:hypothetical protein
MIPFALLRDPVVGATIFIGLSSALLAWGVTADGYARLPLFGSVPFIWACNSAQMSPLIMVSAVVPGLAWVAALKPNLGVASVAYRPSMLAVVGSVVFLAAGFLIQPGWLGEWIANLSASPHGGRKIPITIIGGPILLLSLFRWKRPEARLLLALSLVPQSLLFYDQLLLWLVPKTKNESIGLSLSSVIAYEVGNARYPADSDVAVVTNAYAPLIMAFIFLPCLIMVLRRPNEGELPEWFFADRIRARLRARQR